MGVCVVMAGQLAAPMPEDKKKFTWEVFWPVAYKRYCDYLNTYKGCVPHCAVLCNIANGI